jgi:hypothetical protein
MGPAVRARAEGRISAPRREHRNSRMAELHAARKCSTGLTARAARLVSPLRGNRN